MKKLTGILVTALTLCCLATAAAEEAFEQWVIYFKVPHASIQKISKNHYRLKLDDLPNAEAYMLNDRPFYMIRRLDNSQTHFWQDMNNFRFGKNHQAKATLFYNGGAHEVVLSKFKLNGDQATYELQPATADPVTEMQSGNLQFFAVSHSKPLCNLINEQRHAMKLLHTEH